MNTIFKLILPPITLDAEQSDALTAVAVAAAVKGESPAQIGNDTATAALVSIHQQLQGNAGVAAVSAAGLVALKDVSARQSTNQTLKDASVATLVLSNPTDQQISMRAFDVYGGQVSDSATLEISANDYL
jgi:hypothetical protein